jgi:hypothetical protein
MTWTLMIASENSTPPAERGSLIAKVMVWPAAVPGAVTAKELGREKSPDSSLPPAPLPPDGGVGVGVGGGSYVYWSAAEVALVPPGVVTVISTVPVPAGETAVIWVAELTV